MLMNLDKMRHENWHSKMLTIFEELQSYMAFCDQDLMNLYSYFQTGEVILTVT